MLEKDTFEYDFLAFECFKIHTEENRRTNQEWTIQKHGQHFGHKTQRRQTKTNTTQKLKR